MEAVQLLARILSLLLAGDRSVVFTDHACVQRLHGLRNVRIINSQLVQGMSERGAVRDRMKSVDRADRLARVGSLVGEDRGGEQLWLNAPSLAHDRLLQ